MAVAIGLGGVMFVQIPRCCCCVFCSLLVSWGSDQTNAWYGVDIVHVMCKHCVHNEGVCISTWDPFHVDSSPARGGIKASV